MLANDSIPNTVGAITDRKALLTDFTLADCDCIELRLDSLGDGPEVVDFCERHHGNIPLLLTARDPEQGGLGNLSLSERSALLQSLIRYASGVDLEFANFESFQELREIAYEQHLTVVASSHDFGGFQKDKTLQTLQDAQKNQAVIAKSAVTLRQCSDLLNFEAVAAEMSGSRFSFMGMGPYGPVSRLIAAQHGSILNYGYLGGEPTAPGQWPAKLLKQALATTPCFLK